MQRLKGTYDIYGDSMRRIKYIENCTDEVLSKYGFEEIRTPIIEETSLFQRSVGEGTDVVNKEMYSFKDKGDRDISLRPEGTAGIIRAYLENGLSNQPSPIRLYYKMPMYRYENVQKGRNREFYQLGAELIGSASYKADVEVILIINDLIESLLGHVGKNDIELNLNSIGCKQDRINYDKALKDYIRPNLDKYCDTCKSRFEKNPMRILDCKDENCKKLNENAPIILDYLCDECKTHFEKVKEALTLLGIEYKIDGRIVRGLDYYTKTVFEFVSKIDGLTVFGGGRYDNLVEELGGTPTPAIGFGAGIERIAQLLNDYSQKNMDEVDEKNRCDIYIAGVNAEADKYVMKLAKMFRAEGKSIQTDLMERSVSSQFKYANKLRAKYVITIGEDEINNKIAQMKNMDTGETEQINL